MNITFIMKSLRLDSKFFNGFISLNKVTFKALISNPFMSHSQPVERRGTCAVCHRSDIKLTKRGSLHSHGPHAAPCPGGGGDSTSGHNHSVISILPGSSSSNPTQSNNNIDLSTSIPDQLRTTPAIDVDPFEALWKNPLPPIVKWIPKSVRRACAVLLTEIIQQIVRQPEEVKNWISLMKFTRSVICLPTGQSSLGGVSKSISRHCVEFRNPAVSQLSSQTSSTLDTSIHRNIFHKGKGKGVETETSRLGRDVTAKLEEGNYKGAIRRLCSEDTFAPISSVTINALKEKHPCAPADRRSIVLPSDHQIVSLQVDSNLVRTAIFKFPQGSTGGLDGLTPQHLKDLIRSEGEPSPLLAAITALINVILRGQVPPAARASFFGGRLIALSKKDGGIRPISVGNVLRRLTAKVASLAVAPLAADIFKHVQVGVGVRGGMEGAIHSTRQFVESLSSEEVVVKLDFKNAFNTIRRDVVLEEVSKHIPSIFHFVSTAYEQNSLLVNQGSVIESAEGVQQGDPLGPLLFSLALHPVLQQCKSELSVAYMDDVTLGGKIDIVNSDVALIRKEGESRGIFLNDSKCEVIGTSSTMMLLSEVSSFKRVTPEDSTLLGSPLLAGQAVLTALQEKCDNLRKMTSKLTLLQSHDALTILRHSLSLPTLLHILRTGQCSGHQLLKLFDELLRDALCLILNVSLDNDRWRQASLPVKAGGLGIRRVEQVAPSAYLASSAASKTLITSMLPTRLQVQDQGISVALCVWHLQGGRDVITGEDAKKQKSWDNVLVKCDQTTLLERAEDQYTSARLKAVMSRHAGDWLLAPPLSAVGLRLDNDTVRIASALRLGAPICAPYTCRCGASVDARGAHGLSCTFNAGRTLRHNLLNDIILRSLNSAQVTSVREPNGLFPGSGLRPDGLSLVPWRNGRCMLWDATVPDTLAPSHRPSTSTCAGAAASAAALVKFTKYAALSSTHVIVPVAVETLGAWDMVSMKFVTDLGHRISTISGDSKETAYLFQRLSVAIQRGNAVACMSSLRSMLRHDEDEDKE